jgi:threonine aldolase
MDFIDLRSDTVTWPTQAMREAMANAKVGDDVFGDDPTVNRLQELAAAMLGKEAALFVPSGTMGNLASILAHCNRGDEAILGDKAHTFTSEAGGISALGGVHSHQIPNQPDGTLRLEDIRAAIRSDDPHNPVTRLICLENTHNRCGGTVLSVDYTRAVAQLAHDRNLLVHLDGARIFNAAVALGVPAAELAKPVDSVTFCLSKGLCAPVGSVVCGKRDFIARAHRIRKQLGGGMRQAGILAAAGILALETMIDRLAEDHERARCLAHGLASIPGIILAPATPQTNMIFFSLSEDIRLSASEVVAGMEKRGVRLEMEDKHPVRLVTHYWIDDARVEKTIQAFKEVLAGS